MPYRYIAYYDCNGLTIGLPFESPYSELTDQEREQVAKLMTPTGMTYEWSEDLKHG